VSLEPLEERQLLATFTVANVNDSGPGSLRQALVDANSALGDDDIEFQIPGPGVQRVLLLTPLPTITDTVTIAGGTQDPTSNLPRVEIDGASAGTATGLRVAATNVSIERIAIVNFSVDGIYIESSGTSTNIVGVHLGVHADGTTPGGNGGSGLFVNGASGVTVGRAGSPYLNVISGNQTAGITFDSNATSNIVLRSLIGVTSAGSQAIANGVGVLLRGGASFNQLGSNLQGDGNVISGNTGLGISIIDASSIGNVILGNAIGSNASGTVPLGNGAGGVSVTDAAQTRIGGTQTGEGNIISSNGMGAGLPGVLVSNASQTLIQGNRIGTSLSGEADLGNGGAGVLIRSGSTRTKVGGTETGAGNVIAFNGRTNQAAGVVVIGATTLGNQILSNSIFSNQGLGIDLGGDGVTPNDGGDADTGPNTLLNFPVITNAGTGAGRTLVQGTFNSSPSASFLIQFFASDSRDPSTNGEGQTLIGSTVVSTSTSGLATFNEILTTPTIVGQFLSATATSLPLDSGNTSEFSVARVITSASVADLIVTLTDSPDPAVTGSVLTYTAVVLNQGPNAATNVQFTQGISSTVSISSVSSTQGTLSIIAGGVSGSLGTIASGASVTIIVRVVPAQTGPITTNVQAISNQIDPNPADNNRTETTIVVNPTNLVLTVVPEANPVTLGQNLVFQILVSNNGNFAATNVRLTSTVPNNANLVGVFTSQGTATVVGNQITANLQSIAIGSAVAVRVILSPSAAGIYQQAFTVVSNEVDTVPGDNTANSSVTVLPNADLGVTLQASTASVVVGQLIDFVANVTNNGPSPATNVRLVGSLPAGLSALSATVTNALGQTIGSATIVGQVVTANIGSLAVGAVAFVTVTATPTGSNSGILRTSFAFSSVRDQGDLTPGNDSATADTAVQTADIAVRQELTPTVPTLNNPVTYAVRITNNGPAAAESIDFSLLLPFGATLVSGSVQFIGLPGTFSQAIPGTITGNVSGVLPTGASTVVAYTVIPTVGGFLTAEATVTLNGLSDPDATNNHDVNVTAVSPADLGIQVLSPVGAVARGDISTIRFVVTNNGPVSATNAVAQIVLNSDVEYIGATTSQGSVIASLHALTANLGALAVGAQATIQVQVRPSNVGAFLYSATIDSDEIDNVSGNDSVNYSLVVADAPGRIQFSSAFYQQSENAGFATITLTRAGGSLGSVSVLFQTTTGSAQPDVNFTPTTGSVTFADGQSTATISVPLLADGLVTSTLQVGLLISAPSGGASLGTITSATLDILNVDVDLVAPTITGLTLLGPNASIGAFIVQFSEPVNADRANDPFNYQLFGPAGNPISIFQPSYSADLRQVSITPASPLTGGGFYRLIVNGNGPSGITDIAGNFLDGVGTGASGTSFITSFARGTNLTYTDADGDRVNLKLQRGGLLEVIRGANGDSQVVRLFGVNRRSTLTGTVRRTNLGGNGSTNLGRIEGVAFGRITSRLTSPPFFVDSQFANLTTPVQINAAKRVSALLAKKAK
jgi:uncharacterized repeat protein (TIGR01451 family)